VRRSARPLGGAGLKFSTGHADGLGNGTDANRETSARASMPARADEGRCTRRRCRLCRSAELRVSMTAGDGAHPSDWGPKLAAISTLTVRLFGQYTGRGPSKARTFIDEDTVIVMLQDMLTTAELTLVDNERADIVLATRKIFQEVMSEELIAGVERILQRTVIAFLSANHIDPDIAIGAFVLGGANG
jgi:uncharacterized protein YbcI